MADIVKVTLPNGNTVDIMRPGPDYEFDTIFVQDDHIDETGQTVRVSYEIAVADLPGAGESK